MLSTPTPVFHHFFSLEFPRQCYIGYCILAFAYLALAHDLFLLEILHSDRPNSLWKNNNPPNATLVSKWIGHFRHCRKITPICQQKSLTSSDPEISTEWRTFLSRQCFHWITLIYSDVTPRVLKNDRIFSDNVVA